TRIIRLDGQDQPARTRDTSEFGKRHRHVPQVLQHRDAERAVESAVNKWQMAGVGRCESRPRVDTANATARLTYPIEQVVDTEQLQLRHLQTRQADLSRADTAADIQNALAGSRLERLFQKVGE